MVPRVACPLVDVGGARVGASLGRRADHERVALDGDRIAECVIARDADLLFESGGR